MEINRQQAGGQERIRAKTIDGFIRPGPRQRVKTRPSQAPVQYQATTKNAKSPAPLQPVARHEPMPAPRYAAPSRSGKVVRRKITWRGWALRAASLVIAIFLATGGFLFWRGYSQVHKVFRGTTTVAALSKKTVDPNLLKGEGDGRVNILLLGVGGVGHSGPDLTDTILVLSVDPVNNTAALLSIPRDLWVKMPVNYFGDYQKINAAYSSGKYKYLGKLDPSNANAAAVEAGFNSVDQTVLTALGVKINYHVLVNFQAFRQAIDTVGGVTVDVKEQLYDPTMAWENNWNSVLAATGVQQMDGKKALLFARSRETSSDFARTERQRQIIVGLKDKVLSAGTLSNPTKIEGLMNAFGNNVYSDLSTQGAARLYEITRKIDDSKIASIGLAQAPNKFVTTDRVGNISVVRPVAGLNNYAAIHAYVRSQLVDGYITKEHAPIAVLAPTTAMAETTASELKTYGYTIASAGAGASTAQATTVVDLSKGSSSYTKNYLEKRYGVKAATTMPAGVTVPLGSPKFVIITSK